MSRVLFSSALMGALWLTAGARAAPDLTQLEASAQKGDGRAEYTLGMKYLDGGERPAAYPKAFCWMHRSAEHGNVMGWLSLGMMYRMGQGVDRDDVESYKWFYLVNWQYPPGGPAEIRQDAKDDMESVARTLSPAQIAAGRKRAEDWLASIVARGKPAPGQAYVRDPAGSTECESR